ncbi:MAG TPA: hypothetical protein VIL99_12515 [Ignavibacteria bacterium]
MHITKLILIFLIVPLSLTAQIKSDIKKIDEKTYNLYMSEKWDELTEAVDDAINNGVDFYYLRMRAGIAYYQAKNYMSAIPHFEKALYFIPSDSLANEYLYYSYLFSGRESDSRVLASKFTNKLRNKLKITKPNFFNGFYTEAGYTLNSDYSNLKNKSRPLPTYPTSEYTLTKNQTYFNLSLNHLIGDRIHIFQGYNNISINNVKFVNDLNFGTSEFPLKTNQNEYFINSVFNLGKGIEMTTAFHILNVNYEYILPEPPPVITKGSETLNDFVTLLSLTKYTGKFKLGSINTFSNLNRATQFQNTFEIIFFPSGNLDIYTVSDFIMFSQKYWGDVFISKGIFDQKVGIKIAEKLWVEANYTFGSITNFNEANTFVVFNNTDKITNRFGVNLILPLNMNIELSLRYQLYNQEFTTINHTSTDFNFKSTNYLNHKLIGGIKCTF